MVEAQSCPQVIWSKPRSVKIDRVKRQDTAEAILAPIAETAADLFATFNTDLLKQRELAICVMWLSDQTKSHHRPWRSIPWRSMERCGNCHKVAAYRNRRREGV
jgi:predicted RNA-binding Zn ribbon-like protein